MDIEYLRVEHIPVLQHHLAVVVAHYHMGKHGNHPSSLLAATVIPEVVSFSSLARAVSTGCPLPSVLLLDAASTSTLASPIPIIPAAVPAACLSVVSKTSEDIKGLSGRKP